MFTLTLGLLVSAILLAMYRTDERRAYWIGFALFGSVYFVASLIPPIEARLLTTKGLGYVDSMVPRQGASVTYFLDALSGESNSAVAALALSPDGQALSVADKRKLRLWIAAVTGRSFGTSENFTRIGHSILVLVVAYGGGGLSRWLHARRNGRRADQPLPSPSALEPRTS